MFQVSKWLLLISEISAFLALIYAILLDNFDRVKITNLDKSFHIHCNCCQLTNCVDPNLDKESAVMILLKRPAYVLLPVRVRKWFLV